MSEMPPVLLAMNNPLSSDPHYALYPHPVNCAGWRLWQMLSDASVAASRGEVSRAQYTSWFYRLNVLGRREWSAAEARMAGVPLWASLRGRRVVVLGSQTAAAVRAPRLPASSWGCHEGVEYTCLPHPSGRCRDYNDPAMRARAGGILLSLAPDA